MMKTFIYKAAKKIVEKHDNRIRQQELREKEEKIKIYEKEKLFSDKIRQFKKQYIDNKVNRFKTNSLPQFSIGEIVTTHWYGNGDAWEGTIQMLQNHTPYNGPIDVIITAVHIDYSQLGDIIDLLSFNYNISYDEFEKMIDLKFNLHRDCISWAYNIKVPGDEYNYWHYTIRENKFLKSDSDEAKWSKEAYAKEQKIDELTKEKNSLMFNLTMEKHDLFVKLENAKII